LNLASTLPCKRQPNYIGGHSDTLGGVLCGTAAMMRKIFNSEYLCAGNGIQPFNAWLLLRGLRTLPARIDMDHGFNTESIGLPQNRGRN